MIVYLDKDSRVDYLPGTDGITTDILKLDDVAVHFPVKAAKRLLREIVSAHPYELQKLMEERHESITAALQLQEVS